LVTSIVLVAGATQIFAGTSVNLVIPRLMATFGTDLTTTQWVATGFLLTRTLIMPLLGWLGSVLGNRNMFVIIISGFVVTTIGCGLSTNLAMLVGFRLAQGLILGTMEGLTAVILVGVFPSHQRGLALGLRSIGWSAGQVLFYVAGGYFIEHVSWRLLFFLGVPSGIAAAVLGLLVLPQQREYKGEPVDYLGLLALGAFLVPLLLAISFGRDSNTETSTVVWLVLAALVGGGLFVTRELRTSFPAVNLRLFRLSGFRLICATAFLNNMGLFAALFMVPIFLQQVIGLTALQAGLVIVPALIISGMTGVLVGRLSDLLPPPAVVITLMLSLSVIFYSFSSVTPLAPMAVIVGHVILYRIAMTGSVTPVTVLAVQMLEADQVRMGQGLLGVVRSIGASLGVTIVSVLFEQQRNWHQLMTYATYNSTTPVHHETLRELNLHLHQAGIVGDSVEQMALRTIRQQIEVEAIAAGFGDSFVFICLCFLLASLPMLYLLLRRR
jgi:DHA2 family multidrug resistance protein